ncbi:hypothetical protein DESUT3_32830 [Desulfuromonas versatilis]|uniref:Uncharacterized protein n=1 Tax=Desulfuromonas versatilis TaxID=2802975 RepID=A0ABN6E3U0_9BACT|nr:hypothetical protein [Desulfuromonas versatilis]BCR06214.1 hypothetical protein DESUT3_32830 [Desulfuromonas versatilis]
MPEDIFQQELNRLRLEPLNQVAALKLKQAGIADHPAVLPVFRLMEWGLATGSTLAQVRTARELLRLRHQRDQRSALDYLLANIPGGLPDLHRRLLRLPPRSAAQTLLDLLDLRLKADPKNPYPAG